MKDEIFEKRNELLHAFAIEKFLNEYFKPENWRYSIGEEGDILFLNAAGSWEKYGNIYDKGTSLFIRYAARNNKIDLSEYGEN